jgi:hypothetical protein
MAPDCGNRHRGGFRQTKEAVLSGAVAHLVDTTIPVPETGAIGSAPTCANSPALVDILTSDVGTAAMARAIFRGRRAAVADRAAAAALAAARAGACSR